MAMNETTTTTEPGPLARDADADSDADTGTDTDTDADADTDTDDVFTTKSTCARTGEENCGETATTETVEVTPAVYTHQGVIGRTVQAGGEMTTYEPIALSEYRIGVGHDNDDGGSNMESNCDNRSDTTSPFRISGPRMIPTMMMPVLPILEVDEMLGSLGYQEH